MQIAASLPPVTPPAPLPAAGGAGAAPDHFATLLDQQSQPPSPSHAQSPASGSEDDASPEPAPPSSSARPAEPRNTRGRVPTSRPAATAPATPHARSTAAAAPAETGDSQAAKSDKPAHDDAAPAVDPALAHWLAGLHLPAAPQPPATPRGGNATVADAGDGADAAASGAGATTTHRGAGQGLGLHDGSDAKAEARKDTSAPAREFRLEAMAETREAAAAAAAAPAHAERPAALETPSAALLAVPTPTPAGAAASAPVDVNLPMAPDAPEFAQAFAVQVSVLARDGVQQAELHLNPAETGPVSVQIVMEGTQARIEFGADALPTRQAIEHSLPDLAAALRDAGLTLTGGGVSEHSRGRQADADAPAERSSAVTGAGRRAGSGAAQTVTVRPPRGAPSAGGIDLFA